MLVHQRVSPTKLVILSTDLSLRCHGEMYWIYDSGDGLNGLNSPWLLNDFNVAWLKKMAQSEMIYGWYIYIYTYTHIYIYIYLYIYIYICLLEMPSCPIQIGENTLRFLSQIKDLPIINMVMGQLEDTAVLLFVIPLNTVESKLLFMITKGYVSVYSVIPLISRPWSPLAPSQQWQLGQASIDTIW